MPCETRKRREASPAPGDEGPVEGSKGGANPGDPEPDLPSSTSDGPEVSEKMKRCLKRIKSAIDYEPESQNAAEDEDSQLQVVGNDEDEQVPVKRGPLNASTASEDQRIVEAAASATPTPAGSMDLVGFRTESGSVTTECGLRGYCRGG